MSNKDKIDKNTKENKKDKEVWGNMETDEMIKKDSENLLSNHQSQPTDPKRTERGQRTRRRVGGF